MILQLQIPLPHVRTTLLKAHPTVATAAVPVAEDGGRKFREKIIYLKSLKINPVKALHLNPNLRAANISTLQSIIQCLSSMGLEAAAVTRILDMHPQLLTADPYSDIYPILDFLLHTVQLPFPEVSKSISRCPRILVSDLESQLVPAFKFLTELGFVGPNKLNSQTTMLLVSSVESTLMPKIEFLIGLGIDYHEVRNMVLRSPGLLTFSVEKNYRPKMEYFLNEMNGDLKEIRRFPQYFSFSLERKIKPRHELLVNYGLLMPLSEMLKVSDGEFLVRLVEKRLEMADRPL